MLSRLIISIIAIASLTSCIGYDVLSGSERVCDGSDIKCSKFVYKNKTDVLTQLGNPDKVVAKDGTVKWVFHKGCRYCENQISYRGILIGLLVPIPFVIPVGYNNTIFEFRQDDTVNKITFEQTENDAFLCGFVPAGHPNLGCYVMNSRKLNK
jgi:hypothetical protein